jgi:8-oxo-dGTP pyrophosphatase MutT (NUDIX family)
VLTQERPFIQEILLGEQMCGPFRGFTMGPGGKNDGQSPRRAAVRETLEETGLEIFEPDLRHLGVLRSYFNGTPSFDVDVFRAYRYRGILRQPTTFHGDWQNMKQLPIHRMLETDKYWLFAAVAGMWFGRISVYFGQTPHTIDDVHVEPGFSERLPQR